MRTMILLCTSIFLLVASVCFCMAWYFQAGKLESAVEGAIAKLNAKQTYITYDGIHTSGFPMAINVSVVNPHFKGRMDEFLKSFATDPSKVNLPVWQEDSVLGGDISFGVTLLASEYHFGVNGAWREASSIGDKSYQLTTTSAGPSNCSVKIKSNMGVFGSLWNFQALTERSAKELIEDLRLVDCSGPGYTVTDTNTNDVFISGGPIRFFGSSDDTGSATRQVRLYVKATDYEVTQKGDAVLESYSSALFPGSPSGVHASVYGKRNVEGDFSYNGPISMAAGLKATPMTVDLNSLSITNQVFQSQANFHFSNGPGEKGRTTKLTFHSDANFTEQYDAILRELVKGFVLQLYSPFVTQPADIQPLIRKYKSGELFDIVQPAIPNMHSLGKITQDLDFAYNGDADMTAGEMTLNNLAITAAPYGITGRGSIQMTAGHPMPAANVLLSCNNCGRLIDDISNYTGRVQRTVATVTERPVQGGFNQTQADGVKAFLGALTQPPADPADKTSWNYSITSDGVSAVSISGKRMDEVMALYNQTVVPALIQGQSGAPIQPVAPALAPVQPAAPAQ